MNTTTRDDPALEEVGASAWACIKEMVAALQCDYGRLEELRDERKNWEPEEPQDAEHQAELDEADETWTTQNPDEAEELAELKAAAGECNSADEARERITEDPLSLELGGWWMPGNDPEPDQYRLLLSTGGPAVRIIGELGMLNEPSSARLEVQNWFKPWTVYPEADEDVLLDYARCFYYGD